MRIRSRVPVVIGGAALILAGALTPGLAKGPGDPAHVTLKLAIADPPERQSDPAAQYLVKRVAELTDGQVVIEPTFSAGDGTDAGFEAGVAGLVESGDADLAMIGSRAWPLAGVTSLEALQAPFLIDNDALALAVAKSDIADRALAAMGHGVTGLALWPEDLRHYFALGPGKASFDRVAGLQGATVLIIASPIAEQVLTTLGGVSYQEGVATTTLTGDRGADADSGALTGMLTGLWGAGLPRGDVLVAGDVVPEPKFQTLTVNDASLARLTDAQRAALLQAARDTRDDAFTRQFTEAGLAAKLCQDGATVTIAGPEAVAAFQAAAAPVTADLESDALTKTLIADITALKAKTPASPGAGTCSPPPPAASTLFPMPDTTGYRGDLPPVGSYRLDMSESDLIALGISAGYAHANAGPTTFTFTKDTMTQDADNFDGHHHCSASMTSVGGAFLRVGESFGNCGISGDFMWRQEPDGLRLLALPPADGKGDLQGWLDYAKSFDLLWLKVQ